MEQERGIYVNQKELQSLVEDISLEFFEQSFNHTASFNRRLRTTGGRYLLQTHIWNLIHEYFSNMEWKN